MIISHNITAINTNRQFNIVNKDLTKSAEKLSSGYKINKAADDAAGLSISEKMRKQIRGLSQASLNSEDGISLVQIADGAMAEIHDMLDRGVELSVKAANGTLSASDKEAIQQEIDQLVTEIDSIKERTKFNEIYVLKGDVTYSKKEVPGTVVKQGSLPAWVQFGSGMTDGILSETFTTTETYTTTATTPTTATAMIDHPAASIDFSGFLTDAEKTSLYGQGFNSTCCTCTDFYSIEFTDDTSSSMDTGISRGTFIFKIGIGDINMSGPDPVGELLDRIIAGTNNGHPGNHYTRLKRDGNTLWIYDNRSKKSKQDTDPSNLGNWNSWTDIFYNERPNKANGYGLFGEGVMREIPGYANDRRYENPHDIALQVGAETAEFMYMNLPVISGYALGIDKLNMHEREGAEKAIVAFSAAKEKVSADRSRMGAYQNRLEHNVKNLDNVVENTTAAESQIRDTDMALEMVRYSKNNILSQAGQSMLTQANQINQGVLQLVS